MNDCATYLFPSFFFPLIAKKISFLVTSLELILAVFKDVKGDNFLILIASLTTFNFKLFDKLLLSIFRCAIYEIEVKKEISKKIVISEYLLISNQFFGNKEATLLNGVLDNLR